MVGRRRLALLPRAPTPGSRALETATARRCHRGGAGSARPGSDRQGLLSNLGNPKSVVVFTSLLPQFATGFAGLAAAGLLFCAMTLAWLTVYALVVARARSVVMRPRVRRALDWVTGIALVGFGV